MPVVARGEEFVGRIALPDDHSMEEALLAAQIPAEAAAEFRNVKLPFQLRPHQVTSLQAVLAWNRAGLWDEARCVPGETEFLTPTGWKRIDAYVEGDLVGQVEPETRVVTFVTPLKYTKERDEEVVNYGSGTGAGSALQFMATKGHKLLVYRSRYSRTGKITRKPEVTSYFELMNSGKPFYELGFANTFSVSQPGIPLSEAEIRVMVAVIADGCFASSKSAVSHGWFKDPEKDLISRAEETGRYSRSVTVMLKEDRKITRLANLLRNANIDYVVRYQPAASAWRYIFKAPRLEKEFTGYWWNCSPAQLEAVVEEAEFWDGSRGKGKARYMFSTGSKASADFIQYASAATGRTAFLMSRHRDRSKEGKGSALEHTVSVRDSESTNSIRRHNVNLVKNPDPENKVYCFTVPTGFFVTRFRGSIVLTGNTGKSIVMQLAAIYFAHYGMKSIIIMPPILFDQFAETFANIANHGQHVHVLNGTPNSRLKLLEDIADGNSTATILLMSKEVFKLNLLDIMQAGFQVCMFDECHQGLQKALTKTKQGKRTTYASIKYFVDHTEDARLVLSTGTPITNELIGTYPIISLKSPQAYTSEDDFNYTHVTYNLMQVRTPRGIRQIRTPDPNGYKEVGLLTRNLHHQAVRARKLDVLDIKRPNLQEVPITLHKAHYALYRRVMQEKILEIGTKMIDARNAAKLRMFALQLITDPGIAYQPAPNNAVMEAVQTLLDTSDVKHNKVVLFANFNASVEILAKTFSKLKPAVVYGPNGPEKNMVQVKIFRTDPACRILIANPQAGGVGLTLGDIAQTVIFVEPVSTPGAFDQAASRVILSGQTEPVVIYFLRINNTISKRATEVMLGRAAQANEVNKDTKSMLDELLGVV